ncbi:DUF4435 domain-containing protein [Brevundimonas sp. MEB006b]|uniref:DUF4435 domain-containing protein n=1 Tax=Brevundimonas sp. MEB006b TaxID=3040283 RepID=UPI003306813E
MSWDVGYWSKVLREFFPDISYIFKPQGSKSGVLKVADGLGKSTGHRSLCLVDLDFDDLHKDKSLLPCVVYTYGYAFENDLCDVNILASAVDASLPGNVSIIEIRDEIRKRRDRFAKESHWCVIADQILSFHFSSLFDRKTGKFRSIYDARGASDIPKLSRPRARARLAAQRTGISQSRAVSSPPPADHAFWRRILGHLCWWANYRIARNLMVSRGHSGQMSEDSFAGLCLHFFAYRLRDEGWDVRQHYEATLIPALEAVS